MKERKELIKKENIKKTIEFLVIITIISSPFVSITNIVGMETFLDSFENPNSYIYLKNANEFISSNIKNPSYVIIQKTEHPKIEIKESDTVIYNKITGEIACDKINHIYNIRPIKEYQIKSSYFKDNSEKIFEDQIIGKVVKIIDDNIWNALLIKIWSTTTYNLNINSILG